MAYKVDYDKRRTLRALAGATATGLLTSIPLTATAGHRSGTGDIINCTLISRADMSRVHLLMHNKTATEVAVAGFSDQLIRYDNTTLHIKDAYRRAHEIQSNDRVMVRLHVEAVVGSEHSTQTSGIELVDVRSNTSYLPQGTRVVKMIASLKNGIATISIPSALA